MAGIRYKGQIFSGIASVGDADDINYDNSQTGLSATNIQDAVDELDLNSLKSKQQISNFNNVPFTVTFASSEALNNPYSTGWSTVLTYGTVGDQPTVTEEYQQQLVIPWHYGYKSIALRQKEAGTWQPWDYFVSASSLVSRRDLVVNDSSGVNANSSKTYSPSALTYAGYRPLMFSFIGGGYMDYCTWNFSSTVISGNSISFGTLYVRNPTSTKLPVLEVTMQSLWIPV